MRRELLSRLRPLALATLSALCGLGPTVERASAHGPAPAPLAVLGIDTPGDRASLVRTSIGLARVHGAGGWTYVCPSQWGDYERARAATTADEALTVTIGGGAMYRSTDGACSFAQVVVDDDWYALEAIAWGEQIWAPATLGPGGATSALLATGPTGAAQVARRWEPDDGFRPDTVHGWPHETSDALLVVGATPTPTLWRAEGGADDPMTLDWSSEAMADLPDDTAHISIQTVTASGEVWLVLSRPNGRELWRGVPAMAATILDFTWEAVGAAAASLHGPVRVSNQWLVVRDGVLESGGDTGDWHTVGPVDWTCLHQLSGHAVACTLTTVLAVESLEPEGPQTRPLFDMRELLPPLEGCPADADAAWACESDWVHFGAEAGLLDPAHLLTPNDSGHDETQGAEGCQATPIERPLLVHTLVILLAVVVGLRRRRSPLATTHER